MIDDISILHTGTLYWPQTLHPTPHYPSLNSQLSTQVAIIGGGMTGALCSAVLARAAIPTVLLEEQLVASGSTAANTGLLQYSSDIMLSELAEQVGIQHSVQFYSACHSALTSLSELARTIPYNIGFYPRSSLYCTSNSDHIPKLAKEFNFLQKYGFPVTWGYPTEFADKFLFADGAALTTHGDAEVNPVRFAHGLIEGAALQGVSIFENTGVQAVERRDDKFVIHTANGQVIANYIYRAVGYVPGIIDPPQVNPILRRSYGLATAPNSIPPVWPSDYMMWETARPYFYFRTTPDGRLIAGGLDEDDQKPVTHPDELAGRTNRLLSTLGALFPDTDWKAEYEWCGTFGESVDNLPYLGFTEDQPGVFHALGYGGNGTIYSMIAAEMFLDHIFGQAHPLSSLLSPNRERSMMI